MTDRIRVVLVDDHPMFRDAVARVLSTERDIEVVAEGGSAEDAVLLAESYSPDVILLDIDMPGGGINAARAIRAYAPRTRVVVLTVSEDEDDVLGAMDAGVLAYILKGASARELKRTVRAAYAGLLSGVVR